MAEPFVGSEAVRRGAVSKGELRGSRFRRLFPDVYLPASADAGGLEARSRAAFLLVERRGGVLAGYAAALLLGADCAPGAAPVEVLVGHAFRARAGLLVSRAAVPDRDR